jgi:formylglycine-generating enzyme required for sulfatase activity
VAVNETALSLTVRASSTVDTGKSGTAMVTVPLSYMNMVLATPNADDSVTITGNSAYYYDSSVDYNKGVFIEGRTVTLSPFYIAQYETTYELWYKVYQWAIGNGYTFANAGREGDDGTIGVVPTEPTTKYKPVTYINWRDAVVWCNAYSEMSGKEPVYYTDSDYSTVLRVSTNDSGTGTVADGAAMKLNAKGWRLPTEAEWEYAARGGGTPSTTGTFAYRWVGTDTQSQLGTYAWYSGNSGSATHQVGGKQATSLGLYDMSGNVWEWCWDRYTNSVGTGTELNPIGPISGSLRVYRGGSWNSDASLCAVALRGTPYPGVMEGVIGFRLVLCP